MSRDRTMNPESLKTLGGNVVMRQPKNYPYKVGGIEIFSEKDEKFKKHLGLLTDEEVRVLLQDSNLSKRRKKFDNNIGRFNDLYKSINRIVKHDLKSTWGDVIFVRKQKLEMSRDDNVLYYLLSIHPHKGMEYAAIHGIDRLFFAAKTEYFRKNNIQSRTEPAFERFQDLLYFLIEDSIISGSISIFRYCVKNIRPDQPMNYDYAFKLAIDNNRNVMVEYCMKKLLQNESIDNTRNTALHYAVYFNNSQEVHRLLTSSYRLSLHDDTGRMLRTTIRRSNSTVIFNMLLDNLTYTDETLLLVLFGVVGNDEVEFYEAYKNMVESLLRRINPDTIKRNTTLLLSLADQRPIYNFLSYKLNTLR